MKSIVRQQVNVTYQYQRKIETATPVMISNAIIFLSDVLSAVSLVKKSSKAQRTASTTCEYLATLLTLEIRGLVGYPA